jgi:hypothetical protein
MSHWLGPGDGEAERQKEDNHALISIDEFSSFPAH